MRLIIFVVFLSALIPGIGSAQDPYAPLMLYSGTWKVTRTDSPKPDIMLNRCQKTGRFFTCDQSVNGGLSALLVFIPRPDKPGMYYTQNIRPEGRATSRGDLEINGDVWTFLSNWDSGGKTIYYRTVNTFVGKTRIKYEQSESSNNKDWKLTNSGEETRVIAKH
jgi:hypothetical protein